LARNALAVTHEPIEAADAPALATSARSRWRNILRYARREPAGVASLLVLITIAVMAIAAPVIAPFDPDQQFPDRRYAPPLATPFMLGGDQFGRDVLSRIIFGARVSLFVGIGATAVGCTIGAVLGLASGYFQGSVDMVVQRVIDTMQAFPGLILAMVLVIALGPSLLSVTLAVAVPAIPLATRVVRSATLQATHLDFVSAARAIGASDPRIIARHVLPQTIAPLIIVASSRLGQAIVTEATLGFIGLGVPPPTATWGQMLSSATTAFFLAPWLAIVPGVALSITVFSVNLLGDSLRDTLDPRIR
jgi:peptide/nickel transport system permease protein